MTTSGDIEKTGKRSAVTLGHDALRPGARTDASLACGMVDFPGAPVRSMSEVRVNGGASDIEAETSSRRASTP